MAQQTTHNVVSYSQSTSGLPLVDVTASQTTFDSATSGAHNSSALSRSTLENSTSVEANEHERSDLLNTEILAFSNGHVRPPTDSFAADPSAGDASNALSDDFTNKLASASVDKSRASPGDGPNVASDEASQGDGVADDKSIADVSVELSVNSDTDTSKVDTSERKDGKPLIRTNSTKKPTSFSKVSVTKNFLAKTSTVAPAAPKPGDKPGVASVAAPPTAKPRLVAKSGTALRDRQSLRLGAETAGSPDPSKVWNKNQPVAPPPPKQFTDEELKQQYGIHLATRLQSDEGGKESKWADIDDDEEDWAPDTIAWMDGTKSTVNTQELASPQKEEQPPSQQPPKPAEAPKPILASMKRPDQSMKILKPGAAVIQAKQNGPGTQLSATEKQSGLKIKSPAPPPSKSPWAAIPKVESVSPIVPPVQQSQHIAPSPVMLATQDARAYDSVIYVPAREIAADTFDRSWREGEGGARELFNSSNGRYEPAPERRKNLVKQDTSLKKPAVLQRPSNGGISGIDSTDAPQSRQDAPSDVPFDGRRRSSTDQGDHASSGRSSAPSDLGENRISQASNDLQPNFVRPDPKTGLPMSSDEQNVDAQLAVIEDATPAEDPVKIQERIMREKRELAIKRRKEEAEKEEAAKQERLREKLAALEGAGKSKKEREAEAAASKAAAVDAAVASVTTATMKPSTHVTESAPSVPNNAVADQPKHIPSAVVPSPAQQTLSDLSTREQTTKALAVENAIAVASPFQNQQGQTIAPPEKHHAPEQTQTQKPLTRTHLSPAASSRAPYQNSNVPYKPATSAYSSPGDRKPQPAFGRSPNLNSDAFSPWGPTSSSGNVWGSSGIGNGTFESSSSFAPVPMSQQASSLPPPPGMARASTTTRMAPQTYGQDSRSPNLQAQAIDESRSFAGPAIEARAEPFGAQSRLNGVPSVNGLGRQAHPPGPIGPPSRTHLQSARQEPVLTWGGASHRPPYQLAPDMDAERRMQESSATAKSTPETIYKETFKRTTVEQGKLGGPRRTDKVEYTVHDGQGSVPVPSLSAGPTSTQLPPSAGFLSHSVQDPWKRPTDTSKDPESQHIPPLVGLMPVQQRPIGAPALLQPASTFQQGSVKYTPVLPTAFPVVDDSSPPPPETETHPVNSGDAHHPHVKLPKPQAKVKLPPAASVSPKVSPVTHHHSAMVTPQRHAPPSPWAVPGANRPLVQTPDWQARFNGLFNRTPIQTETPPSPPKTPPKYQGASLAVSSSSRALLDDQAYVLANSATVSLPQARQSLSIEGFTLDDSADIVSKPAIDDMFNEELSFGSLPRIAVPRQGSYNLSPYTSDLFANLLRTPRAVESQSHPDGLFYYKSPHGYFVKILGTKLNNKLIRPGTDTESSAGGPRRSISGHSPQDRSTSVRGSRGKGPRNDARSLPDGSVGSARRRSSKKTETTTSQVGTQSTSAAHSGKVAAAAPHTTSDLAQASSRGEKKGSPWEKSRFPRQAAATKAD